MTTLRDAARWRAAATAALLVVAGAVMGVVADRLWMSPPDAQTTPLTAQAMVARLGLSSAEAAHVRALLDSLHVEVHAAVQQGPDSLRRAVRNAQQRIEAALPPDTRSEFHTWLQQQYRHMMDRTHDARIDHR